MGSRIPRFKSMLGMSRTPSVSPSSGLRGAMQDGLAKLLCQQLGRQTLGKQVPLDLVATMKAQGLELRARLGSFRNDLQSQAVRHVDDGDCDRCVVRIGRDVADERDIDLERVDEKTLQ